MLDKLVANAIEFGTPDTPVVVRLERDDGAGARSTVANDGAAAADRNGRPAVRLDGLGAIGSPTATSRISGSDSTSCG